MQNKLQHFFKKEMLARIYCFRTFKTCSDYLQSLKFFKGPAAACLSIMN